MATVLVVDDESDIRELLADTLLDAGFQVIEAASGESGKSVPRPARYHAAGHIDARHGRV